MQLSGQLDADAKALADHFLKVADNVYTQATQEKNDLVRAVLVEMLTSLKSLTVSIYQLCCFDLTSSQAVFALQRSLLESALSVMALCKDVTNRASMFEDFGAVLDWKLAVIDSENVGTWCIPATPENKASILQRKNNSDTALQRTRHSFIDGKHSLPDVLARHKHTHFRNRWYPEERRELLREYGMEHLYDTTYSRLSCCVHSDTAALRLFRDIKKNAVIGFACMVFGCALRVIVDKCGYTLPQQDKGILNLAWEKLTAKVS